jgi:hypothetical protein
MKYKDMKKHEFKVRLVKMNGFDYFHGISKESLSNTPFGLDSVEILLGFFRLLL